MYTAKLDRLGNGNRPRVQRNCSGAADDIGLGAGQADDGSRLGRRSADECQSGTSGANAGDFSVRQVKSVELAVENTEPPLAAFIESAGDSAIGQKRVGAQAKVPLRDAELGRHFQQGLNLAGVIPVEVPPPRLVRNKVEIAGG